MNKIIGISGKKRTGKDTVAKYICSISNQYVQVGIADAVKELALKMNPTLFRYYKTSFAEYIQEYGWEEAKQVPQVRKYLQQLGDNCRQIIGDDVWIRACLNKMIDPNKIYVISDIRYPNEVEYFSKLGPVIRLIKNDSSNDTHISECALNNYPFDPNNIIRNDGSLEELKQRVNLFLW